MEESVLRGLIRPVIREFRGAERIYDYGRYREEVKRWEGDVIEAFRNSLGEIMSADEREEAIPREAVLTLAVATNQILRNYRGFYMKLTGDKDNLQRAKELCAKFKVKGLMKATDYRWNPEKPSKLEETLESALCQTGEVHCRRCGRLLTNTLSVQRGIGPICIHKI